MTASVYCGLLKENEKEKKRKKKKICGIKKQKNGEQSKHDRLLDKSYRTVGIYRQFILIQTPRNNSQYTSYRMNGHQSLPSLLSMLRAEGPLLSAQSSLYGMHANVRA